MYEPPMFETVERAIEFVLKENKECQMEWYSLGKTREQFIEHLTNKGIDEKKLGVFISGRFEPPLIGKLTFMPISWVDLSAKGRSIVQKQLATNRQLPHQCVQ